MRLFKRKPLATPQAATSTGAPYREEHSIGALLMRMRKLTQEQLHKALGMQERAGEHLLGALLVENGAVSQLDVAKALEIQAKLRAGDRATAELDLLDAVMAESAECNRALDEAIAHRKARARDRGEQTGAFLLAPKVA